MCKFPTYHFFVKLRSNLNDLGGNLNTMAIYQYDGILKNYKKIHRAMRVNQKICEKWDSDTKKSQERFKALSFKIVFFLLSIFSILILFLSFSSSKAKVISFLNQAETEWLEKRQRPVKIGITSIPGQIVVTENNNYKGFSVDLFKKIQDSINIDFEYVYFDTWNEVVDAGINGSIDVIFLAQKNKARLAYFDFTDTIISQQNKIITKIGRSSNLTLEELSGLKVAAAKGSAVFEYLKRNKIDLIPTKSEEEALLSVSNGFADAAISEAVRASHYLEMSNIKNLNIAGNLDYDYHLRIASRNDSPILNIILSKTIDNIPKQDIQALHFKWGFVKDKDSYFNKQALKYLSIIFAIIIPFVFYISILNNQLRNKVSEKSSALQNLQTAHDEINYLKLIAEQEARTDELTHVLNNRGFREKLNKYIEEYGRIQQTFSLVLLDIDYFKNINDKMGHDTGDKVLSDFARTVKRTLRTCDSIGRVGGEEFAIIYPNTSLLEAVKMTEYLRSIVSSHIFSIDNHTFQISASFGVSEFTKQDTSTSLYKKTDVLLYQSKSNGRNRVSSEFFALSDVG